MKYKIPNISTWLRGSISLALVIVLLLFGSIAPADVLVTDSDDSMSGTLTRVVDGILVFRTSLRGQLMMPMGEVRSLETDDRWIVTLSDGSIYIGRFVAGGVSLDVADGNDPSTISLSHGAVTSAKNAPPLPERDSTSSFQDQPWRQKFFVGVQTHHGSEDAVTSFVDWDAQRELMSATLGFRLRISGPDSDSIGDMVRGELNLLKRSDTQWSPLAQVEIRRNIDELLELRTGLTIGLRYDFTSDSGEELWGDLGLAATYSRWEGFRGKERWLGRSESEEAAALRIHLAGGYSRQTARGGMWESSLTLLPGISSVSTILAEAETSLTYLITTRLHLRLDMLVSYGDAPVFEELNNVDASLGASIQFNF